jgi:hypothetical protein
MRKARCIYSPPAFKAGGWKQKAREKGAAHMLFCAFNTNYTYLRFYLAQKSI